MKTLSVLTLSAFGLLAVPSFANEGAAAAPSEEAATMPATAPAAETGKQDAPAATAKGSHRGHHHSHGKKEATKDVKAAQ